ncbi:hypothetical protein CY34DRAFT_807882 [Suillus luteus UH-Slu-Lm8-n1]|uniref:Unplaced genomic scaffold CY34scaffold_198, whole genome shotgun sequence n=1 Tax=Suillus luteus UH-Slu-Lm8-n1 TaxID=930992 RepID=A0A0D0ADI5_9AGAM|nr:hypothetical protein CY34DRAFT_807882 [Suillus luteus UH-Slu-Lm8-n1]
MAIERSTLYQHTIHLKNTKGISRLKECWTMRTKGTGILVSWTDNVLSLNTDQ